MHTHTHSVVVHFWAFSRAALEGIFYSAGVFFSSLCLCLLLLLCLPIALKNFLRPNKTPVPPDERENSSPFPPTFVIFYRVVVVVRMGERKVLNKYIPPDFDPSKVPKGKRPADGQIKVRMMLPMSICCQTCGNFISKGTKFNSRKEDAKGETYLGLKIFRFYFRCPRCSGEIAMKTDPERSDYIGTFLGGKFSLWCWKNVSHVTASLACVERSCRVASLLFARRTFLMSFRVLTLVLLSLFNLTRRAYENS